MKTKKPTPAQPVDLPCSPLDENAVWRLLADLWRQYPRFPSTFGPCSNKCGSGHAGRGSGPCRECVERELARHIGEVGAREYHSAIQRVTALEGAMFREANDTAQQRAASDEPSSESATGALAAAPLFGALRLAVEEKRAAQAAYNEWYDGRKATGRDRKFPTEEDVAEECRLRTKLGEKQRAVQRAADAVADAPNDQMSGGTSAPSPSSPTFM